MRVVSEVTVDIPVEALKDGQIAVITKWPGTPTNEGQVVQRYKDILVCLGLDSGHSWTSLLKGRTKYPEFRVLVLPPGTKLEI